jgi:hypothetical protein
MHSFFLRIQVSLKFFCSLLLVFLYVTVAFSQEVSTIPDTLAVPSKSPKKTKKSAIDADILYQANDSIVLFSTGKAFLYGKGAVDYKEIDLKADYIEIDTDSSQVYASGAKDSVGTMVGYPVFKEGKDTYESHTMKYNFNTKKGYIVYAVTKQGEGYVVSDQTKKTETDILCVKDAQYTTCSNHDDPHFYLDLTQAKIKPKSYIVTGPAYLVMEGVPLPLIIPFGYFPFSDTYSSGIIMPSYGEELTRGFYIKEGGYYFAINDYCDLALTGDIYTNGSWSLRGASSYAKRYKYKGSINISYMVNIFSDPGLPDYSKSKDFSINWMHVQDSKANMYSTFSSSVNFATSSYERNNVDSYYNPSLLSQSTRSSSVSFTQRFPDSPWTISSSMSANQRTQDSTLNLNLPDMTVSMSRIYPFKRQEVVGAEKWYEKIYLSYTGHFFNSITGNEDRIFNSSFSKGWDNETLHTLPISASFNIFKYLNITPSVNYNERWYFSGVKKSWNYAKDTVKTDTVGGFKRVYDYNAGLSMQTKVYAFFKPLPAIFGEKINMIRWVITPIIGYSMAPDFGAKKYGYWDSYVDKYQQVQYYSPYQNNQFGVPTMGRTGDINFSFSNNLEMKLKNKKDTINQFTKVSLIDNFSVTGSYNLVADSMKWSDFNANLRLKITDNMGINLTGSFDPYEYKLNDLGDPVAVNRLRWDDGKLPQLIGTGTSFGYTFDNKTFSKDKPKPKTDNPNDIDKKLEPKNQLDSIASSSSSLLSPKKEEHNFNKDGYMKFEMPWHFRFDYSLLYGRSTFNTDKLEYNLAFTHNVSFSGDLALTSKWKFSFTSSYDITNNQITYTSCNITRDLHCWTMTASFVPVGLYKSYNITIAVKSTLLKDLKYQQRANYSDGVW